MSILFLRFCYLKFSKKNEFLFTANSTNRFSRTLFIFYIIDFHFIETSNNFLNVRTFPWVSVKVKESQNREIFSVQIGWQHAQFIIFEVHKCQGLGTVELYEIESSYFIISYIENMQFWCHASRLSANGAK